MENYLLDYKLYQNRYRVYEDGKIFDTLRNKYLKLFYYRNDYIVYFRTSNKNKKLNRVNYLKVKNLLANLFLDRKTYHQVYFRNNDNTDLRVSNLYLTLLKNRYIKFDDEYIINIKNYSKVYLAKKFNVNVNVIYFIIRKYDELKELYFRKPNTYYNNNINKTP